MKKLKLEVGKTYRNRKGEEVRIIRDDGNTVNYPCQGNNREWCTESGRWAISHPEHPNDLIEELPETRYTFDIPDGVKEITLDYFGNRLVVEMVPEIKEPKPGDVMINEHKGVYIFKAIDCNGGHNHFAFLGCDGRVAYNTGSWPGRPATPEEAQVLFDALKKEGKRWNQETMQVEDVPESDRIRAWVWANLKSDLYDKSYIAEAIAGYLKHKEGEK